MGTRVAMWSVCQVMECSDVQDICDTFGGKCGRGRDRKFLNVCGADRIVGQKLRSRTSDTQLTEIEVAWCDTE